MCETDSAGLPGLRTGSAASDAQLVRRFRLLDGRSAQKWPFRATQTLFFRLAERLSGRLSLVLWYSLPFGGQVCSFFAKFFMDGQVSPSLGSHSQSLPGSRVGSTDELFSPSFFAYMNREEKQQ